MSSEKTASLTVYYQNVNGLITKKKDLYQAIKSFDIYCFTETNLNSDHENYELFNLNKYKVFRRDRDGENSMKKSGGGCLIAIKKSENYAIVHQTSWREIKYEDIWITLKLICGKSIHILCAYLPPKSDDFTDNEFYTYMNLLTRKVCALVSTPVEDKILLLGDFNASKNKVRQPSIPKLLDFCGLLQNNLIVNLKSEVALDLVISNSRFEVKENFNPVVKLDNYHPALEFCINLTPIEREREVLTYRNYKGVDWEEVNHHLEKIDWSFLIEFLGDPDNMLEIFYENLTSILNLFCPIIGNEFHDEYENIETELINDPKKF